MRRHARAGDDLAAERLEVRRERVRSAAARRRAASPSRRRAPSRRARARTPAVSRRSSGSMPCAAMPANSRACAARRERAPREPVRRPQRVQAEPRQRERMARDRQRGPSTDALEPRPLVDDRLHQPAIGVRVGTEAARGLVERVDHRPPPCRRRADARASPAARSTRSPCASSGSVAKERRRDRKRVDRRADVVHEARQRQLGGSHAAAERRLGFEHDHAPSGSARGRSRRPGRSDPSRRRSRRTVGHVLATLQFRRQTSESPMTDGFAGYWYSRFLFERALALIYLVAFLAAANQFVPLLGERGLSRSARSSEQCRSAPRRASSSSRPTIRVPHRRLARRRAFVPAALRLPAVPRVGGVGGRVGARSGCSTSRSSTSARRSTASAGNRCCSKPDSSRSSPAAAPRRRTCVVIWLWRWMLFRLMFGAGLIKLRGDSCWRDLTCLDYYFETQPMPNPLSWYFHWMPRCVHARRRRVQSLRRAGRAVRLFPAAAVCVASPASSRSSFNSC